MQIVCGRVKKALMSPLQLWWARKRKIIGSYFQQCGRSAIELQCTSSLSKKIHSKQLCALCGMKVHTGSTYRGHSSSFNAFIAKQICVYGRITEFGYPFTICGTLAIEESNVNWEEEEVFLWGGRILCRKKLILYAKFWHLSVAADARRGPLMTTQSHLSCM